MTMHRLRGFAIFAVAVTLFGYGQRDGVLAQDATPGAISAGDGTTLIVVEHATTDTVIDLGEEGDSIGDLLGFGNAVFDEGNENEVGMSQGSCVRTVPGEAWECMFSVIFDEGQLTVEGPFYDTRSSELAITGGTGANSTARGQMRLEAISETEFRFTFEFA
jgi:allene oxide cyclase